MDHSTTLPAEIASVLLENLNVEVSSFQDDLIEIGLLDSLKVVELLVELEQRFDIEIPLRDVDINSFRSVASIADFVAKMKGPKPMAGAAASASASQVVHLPLVD